MGLPVRSRPLLLLLMMLMTLVAIGVEAQNRSVAPECQLVPLAGICADQEKNNYWTYSSKISGCTRLFGCYSVRDRNVFVTLAQCENQCFNSGTSGNDIALLPGSPGTSIAPQCQINPSPGRCAPNDVKTFWSFSSKTNSCIRVTGCYSVNDRNIWNTREMCRRGCVVRSNGEGAVTLPAIIPGATDATPGSGGATTPSSVTINMECRLTPSSGTCLPQERRTVYTYSTKSGTCVEVNGCYSLRDRNVFVSLERCQQSCFQTTGSLTDGQWTMDLQCWVNPTPGRCADDQKNLLWTYSSKTQSCTQIFGCYSVRDRNVFLTRDQCNRMCVGEGAVDLVRPDMNIKIAMECRINPSAGSCRESEKRTFYSYSGKTGDCAEIFGCFSAQDRNVFLTLENCRQGCFVNDSLTVQNIREAQCYVSPAQGRCSENQKQTVWTFSSKTSTCSQIFGCYSVRDRNVFVTKSYCDQACLVDTSLPSLEPGTNVTLECLINPSVGQCTNGQSRSFYSYSTKTGTCTQIYGCYSVRDRNVFLTEQACRDSCFASGTDMTGIREPQCFVNPSPNICVESQKITVWSYSSKTMTCSQIYGCYSIRDRNTFVSKDVCDRACAVDTSWNPVETANNVSLECRINPSPGQCMNGQKHRFYSYSGKIGACTQIFGCYSVRDRNVFLTEAECTGACLTSDNAMTGVMHPQCFIMPAQGLCSENARRTYFSYSSKTASCLELFGCYSVRDRNVFLTRDGCESACVPGFNGTAPFTDNQPTIFEIEQAGAGGIADTVARECLVSPSPGRCVNGQQRTFYTYSSKIGSCTQLFGCYSVQDRNVFLTEQACNDGCTTSPNATGIRQGQCYVNPAPGRCMESQKTSVWTFSAKADRCTQIFGCYNIRDRNVFLQRDECERACAVDTTLPEITPGENVALECQVNPSPGRCQNGQHRTFYTYSSKLGSCARIYGCYNLQDRNVFLTEENCRNSCFLTGSRPSGVKDSQCYINPSPGNCAESQKNLLWSYSSKIDRCTEIYGCYTVRDRNVFISKEGCERACAVDSSGEPVVLPDNVNIECRVNPSPGICRNGQKRTFYSYSTKTGTCTLVNGCYSIRDRNVFLTLDSCLQGCFSTERPADMDAQCFVSPSPSNCGFNQMQTYYTYSTKTSGCVQIFGCYSIRDRNVFPSQDMCRRTCRHIDSFPTGITGGMTSVTGSNFMDNIGQITDTSMSGMMVDTQTTFSGPLTSGGSGMINQGVTMQPDIGVSGNMGVSENIGMSGNMGVSENIGMSGNMGVSENMVMSGNMDASGNVMQESGELRSLTDLDVVTISPGLRISRECLTNPSPGFCLDSQRRTFWTFSTKTNSCTRIVGCYDIHDRNTWLSQNGCQDNCFRSTNQTQPDGIIPLECQLNPTPGRCLLNEQNTVWVYNPKLNQCTQQRGCYDFHDRNVWATRDRCLQKCRVQMEPVFPDIPTENNYRIAPECRINPSPGRCLESQQLVFWSFSSKTSSCMRVRGCFNIRDRNTWLTRDACLSNCLIDQAVPDSSTGLPPECRLIPSPGRCLESQRTRIWAYSEKLASCIDITGCYDFHDRNVWRTREMCESQCNVNNTTVTLPDLSEYDIAVQCQIAPTPGRCLDNQKRSFYTFSGKTGSCVQIYGCYTINDRNVWFTDLGCRQNCLIPKQPLEPEVAPGCLVTPVSSECLTNQRQDWWTYDQTTKSCTQTTGCYRLGDRNIFMNKRRCELNCFGRTTDSTIDRECQLNPSPGVCSESEKRSVWSYSQKTSSCVLINGCYTLRDRNVWLTQDMCRQKCVRNTQSDPTVLPNFLGTGVVNGNNVNDQGERRGRRGRLLDTNSVIVSRREDVARRQSGNGNIVRSSSNIVGDVQRSGNGAVNGGIGVTLRESQASNINSISIPPRMPSMVLTNLFST